MKQARFAFDSAPDGAISPLGYAVIIAAWIVPGLGHLLLKRWGRAVIVFLCVAGLALAGYALRGRVYSIRGGDMFSILGDLAEVGMGAMYFISRAFEPHGPDTARVVGDFGTRFLAIAGLLNFLCVLDVWSVAREQKRLTQPEN